MRWHILSWGCWSSVILGTSKRNASSNSYALLLWLGRHTHQSTECGRLRREKRQRAQCDLLHIPFVNHPSLPSSFSCSKFWPFQYGFLSTCANSWNSITWFWKMEVFLSRESLPSPPLPCSTPFYPCHGGMSKKCRSSYVCSPRVSYLVF